MGGSGSFEEKKSGYVSYERLEDTSLDADIDTFTPRSKTFGPRFQMIMFLLGGGLTMVAHHFFCKYLDRRPVNSILFNVHGIQFTDQAFTSIVGNTIAYISRTLLASAIGLVFIQVLWTNLRKERYEVGQIDNIMACRGHPFSPASFPAWGFAFWLAAISALSSLMAFVTIVAPGSLKIDSAENALSMPCTVNTLNLTTANMGTYVEKPIANNTWWFGGAQANVMRFTTQVFVGASYLPAVNPCGLVNGVQSGCQYNIDFLAPIANCSVVPNFDFTYVLPEPATTNDPTQVWYGNMTTDENEISVFIATRDLVTSTKQAIKCRTYNATYHATISHSNSTSAVINVTNTEPHNPLNNILDSTSEFDYIEMQFDALAVAFVNILQGNVSFNPSTFEFGNNDNFLVAYSPLGGGSPDSPWTWKSDVATALPTFMQNISLSLLSGELSKTGNSTTSPVNTTCFYPAVFYSYNPIRLLATYGGGILIAAFAVSLGFHAVRKNGAEESVAFSRLMGAILNRELYEDRFQLSKITRITADADHQGRFRLASRN